MVVLGDTVIDVPVPTNAPPHEPLYQRHKAPAPNEPPFLVRVTDPPGQIVVGLAEADVGATEAD